MCANDDETRRSSKANRPGDAITLVKFRVRKRFCRFVNVFTHNQAYAIIFIHTPLMITTSVIITRAKPTQYIIRVFVTYRTAVIGRRRRRSVRKEFLTVRLKHADDGIRVSRRTGRGTTGSLRQ